MTEAVEQVEQAPAAVQPEALKAPPSVIGLGSPLVVASVIFVESLFAIVTGATLVVARLGVDTSDPDARRIVLCGVAIGMCVLIGFLRPAQASVREALGVLDQAMPGRAVALARRARDTGPTPSLDDATASARKFAKEFLGTAWLCIAIFGAGWIGLVYYLSYRGWIGATWTSVLPAAVWVMVIELALSTLAWARMHLIGDVLLIAARAMREPESRSLGLTSRHALWINRWVPHSLVPVVLLGAFAVVLTSLRPLGDPGGQLFDIAGTIYASPTMTLNLTALRGLLIAFFIVCAMLFWNELYFIGVKERTLLDHSLPPAGFGEPPFSFGSPAGRAPATMAWLVELNPVRVAQATSALDLMLRTQHTVGYEVMREVDRVSELLRHSPTVSMELQRSICGGLSALGDAVGEVEQALRTARDSTRLRLVSPPPVNLVELASDVANSPRFSGRVNVVSTCPEVLVRGDASALLGVITALVENADVAQREVRGEVTAPGRHPVQISLCIRRDQAVLSVQDHGRGFPPSVLGRHPEPLNTGFGSPFLWQGKMVGLGLGLYLADYIVRQHGGRLDLMNGAHPVGSGPRGANVQLQFALSSGDTLHD